LYGERRTGARCPQIELSGLAEPPLVISTPVENSDDHNLGRGNAERDGRSPLEPDGSESGHEIIASRPALRKSREPSAGCLDARDVGLRIGFARLTCNAIVKSDQVGFGERTEADSKPLHSSPLLCGACDARGAA